VPETLELDHDRAVDIAGLLQDARLVTITGMAGVGKSRLAAEVARHAGLPTFGRDLTECPVPGLLPQAVAGVLELARYTDLPPAEALARALTNREAVLVLDTCEHLTTACGELAEYLLDAAPGLRILATSRRAIGAEGECVVRLRPLRQDRAVRLLMRRAAAYGAVLPDYMAARVCAYLDGDPLSVELAARRLRHMSGRRLSERLSVPGARFALLTDGPAEPLRHHTCRAAIGWSHELCTREERLLWAQLSAFPGEFGAEQAERLFPGGAQCADLEAASVLIRGPYGGLLLPLGHREYGADRLAQLG
jgi:predicted ATPase